MQTLAARGLAEADKAQLIEPVADLSGAFDHHFEGDVGRRIEVEHKPAGLFWREGFAVPGVELQGPCLCGRHQRLDAVELDVGLSITPYLDLGDQG